MRRLMMRGAVIALTALPIAAYAQDGGGETIHGRYLGALGVEITAESLRGKTVYMPRLGVDDGIDLLNLTDVPSSWEAVADVTDILVDANGRLGSVVLDAGGFLGMGQAPRVLDRANLTFVADADTAGDYFIVYTGSRTLLELDGDFDADEMARDGYNSAFAATGTMGGGTTLLEDDSIVAPNIDRTELQPASLNNRTIDDLEGIAIYGPGDERVGEIGTMVLGDGGMIDKVIVDVGGFLGLGERRVAMELGAIELLQTSTGILVGYIALTEEQLEGLPEWRSGN